MHATGDSGHSIAGTNKVGDLFGWTEERSLGKLGRDTALLSQSRSMTGTGAREPRRAPSHRKGHALPHGRTPLGSRDRSFDAVEMAHRIARDVRIRDPVGIAVTD